MQRQYDEGELYASTITKFVNKLLRKHPESGSFPYQTALAAIAVVLDGSRSFSEEYLSDLARIKTGRFVMASKVARLCLKERYD